MAPVEPHLRRKILGALLVAFAVAALEATVVATAMPIIVGQLGGFARFPWLFSAYLLAQTALTPLYGRLADALGRRPVLLWGLGAFLAGSVLCAAAPSMDALIAFRAVQGIGAAAIFPTALTLVGDLYPPVERARVQGLLSSVWAVSALVGPPLGGFLVSRLGWPAVFLVQVPPGLLAALALRRWLRESAPAARPRLDLPGAALFALAAGLLTLALQAPAHRPAWLGAALAAALAFLAWERRAAEPLLPLAVLCRPAVAAADAGGLLAGVLIVGVSALVPPYVQGVLGGSPTAAGFALTTMSMGWPLAATAAGRALLQVGYRRTALLGALLGAAGAATLATLAGRGLAPLVTGSFLTGAGLGLTTTTYLIALQAATAHAERGAATASQVLARQLGQALGAALFGAVVQARLLYHLGPSAADAAEAVRVVERLLAGGPAAGALAAEVRAALGAALREAFAVMAVAALAVVPVARALPAERPTAEARPGQG